MMNLLEKPRSGSKPLLGLTTMVRCQTAMILLPGPATRFVLVSIRFHTHTSYTVVEGMRRDVRILLVGDGSFLSVPFISPWRQA